MLLAYFCANESKHCTYKKLSLSDALTALLEINLKALVVYVIPLDVVIPFRNRGPFSPKSLPALALEPLKMAICPRLHNHKPPHHTRIGCTRLTVITIPPSRNRRLG
ncbi:hypothetical protein FA95DRAFT_245190 [Auriscalpium vulgare]|uniref:Uncharacterized protein n=1 Tax=Auriscalpium vulgare TaxID=40419 RepID=A0ACB8RL18_9AGAM|nr:hypothetical protein FA95DRAFT_245190 [Auriscalpium vulgare]